MDKFVGVGFAPFLAFVGGLVGTAVAASSPLPRVLHGGVADVALLAGEGGAGRVASVGQLAAIQAAAGKQGG